MSALSFTGCSSRVVARSVVAMVLLSVSVPFSVTRGVSAGDNDWPQWRGPQRNGISRESGLYGSWGQDGPPLLWEAEGSGKGYASVAIAEGRIFTLGRRQDDECLIVFRQEDGKELWATPFGTGGHSNGTPTVDGQRVYAIGLDGDLVCCDVESGKILWQKNFRKDFSGKMMSGWGYSESPLIDGPWLLCTPGAEDAMVVALDKLTGETIWKGAVEDLGKRGRDGAAYSSIVVSHGAGVKQYIQLVGRAVVGFRATDGKQLWSYDGVNNGTANIPTPIVEGDYVFCSTGYGGGGAALLKLNPDGQSINVEEVYYLPASKFQNHHGGMIKIGDYIYAGAKHNNGFPTCIEMETGKIVWGGKTRGPGSGSAAIVYADHHLVFRYQDGTVALIKATPDEYELVGSFRPVFQQGRSWAHPVIADGKLYLREQDRLMCYDLQAK